MQFSFIPNYLTLLDKEKPNIEICEKSDENGSGECMHTYKFHRLSNHDTLLQEIERDINSSQIAIREVAGGVHLITSLRFFNEKLTKVDQLFQLYFDFFVKAILYLVNYYYYIKKEKDIHIEKAAFQTLLGFQSNKGNFHFEFDKIKKSLSDIGVLEFLFIYSKSGLDHYVFNESAFLAIKDYKGSVKLKVLSNIIIKIVYDI
jgi:hypothetical protein